MDFLTQIENSAYPSRIECKTVMQQAVQRKNKTLRRGCWLEHLVQVARAVQEPPAPLGRQLCRR